LSSVAHRLEQQSLLRPFVEQELFLLPVIIDMQLRGVQVDLKQLGQAKMALKRHIDQIVRTNTYVCGDALFRARVNAPIACSALFVSLCCCQHLELDNIVGYHWEPTSATQVSNVLYEKYRCPPPKLQDRGRSSAKQKLHPTTSTCWARRGQQTRGRVACSTSLTVGIVSLLVSSVCPDQTMLLCAPFRRMTNQSSRRRHEWPVWCCARASSTRSVVF
jgi:hypothetical protein